MNTPPAKRPGKEYKPKRSDCNRVMLYVAGGLSEPAIAAILGICQMTLRKYFAEELDTGRSKKLAENLARLEKAATKGNVTAMKHLDGKFGLANASHTPAPPREEPLGKKAAAEAEAQTAHEDSGWSGLLQ